MSEKEKENDNGNDKDFSFSEMISEINLKRKKIDKLSKFVDFVIEDAMPKFFGKNIEQAYENSKKTADFIMRHLI